MSQKISLVPGEQVVMSSDREVLTLTTKRVRYDSELVGRSVFVSITLDSVASCGLKTKSSPILLLLGAVAVYLAFTQGAALEGVFASVAVILGLAYLITRRKLICIASKGGQSILAPARGMNRKSVIEFLEAVEQEKLR